MPLCSSPLQHISIFKHTCTRCRSKDKCLYKMTGVQLNEFTDNPLYKLVNGSFCYNVCHTLHRKINRLSMSPPSAKRLKTTTPPSQPPSQPASSVASSSNGVFEVTAPSEAVELPLSTSTAIPISPPTCDRSARRERLSLVKELEKLKAVVKMKDNELMNEKKSKRNWK